MPWEVALGRVVAQRLAEANVRLLVGLVRELGEERARYLLQRALDIEAEGGMFTNDGARRRTPGGVFIHMAKEIIAGRPEPPVVRSAAVDPPPPAAFTWEDRASYVKPLLEEPGVAGSAKIVVTGRPGRTVEQGAVVMAMMRNDKAPSMPKGLPEPPGPTDYIVYMTAKQWRKVSASLQDPADVLVVEGYPAFDERLKTVAVFALNVTTKLLQAAKRGADAATAGTAGAPTA